MIYDFNGNIIANDAPSDTSSNYFEVEKINLFDNAEFVGNKRWADNRWYDNFTDYSAYEIPINGVGTYYTNIVSRYSTGNVSGNNGIIILDENKNVLSSTNLIPYTLLGYDSTGTGIYDVVGSFKVTDKNARYLRLWHLTESFVTNPNINTQGYDFIEKGGEFLSFREEYDLTKMSEQVADGVIANVDNAVDDKILEQVGRPNNLYGRRVYMIGDSNMDNWNSANKELFEQRYGCTVQSFAEYGATFEVRDGNGKETTARGSAVGQWNLILQNEPIDSETLMLPEDIAIFFMMGTNCVTKGTEANRSDMDVTTAIGAMEWVFTQISYYCRGDIPVGIILPVQSGVGHDNIIWSAERHGFPYINIEKHCRQIQDNINSSIKAESFIVTGNHIAVHGWKHFRRIVHNWMAYNV